MAGPNEDDNPGHRQQTGTRPKSRTNTSPRNTSLSSVTGAGGSHQALLSLMREYQAVTESLALARDQIEREGQRVVTRRHQETRARGQTRAEDRIREMDSLRARLLELEMEVSTSNTEPESQAHVTNNSLDSENYLTRLR